MLYDKIQLESDETILKVVRKHWFVIVTELILIGFVALAPLALFVFGSTQLAFLSQSGITFSIPGSFIVFGIATWMLFSVFVGYAIWTHYYLDLWIVTDRRIISVDQIHFFNRTVAIFRLERLQDIEYRVNGILPTFLNFGVISAQTAGHHEHNFRATGMPDPRGLQSTIQKAMDTRLQTLHVNPNLQD